MNRSNKIPAGRKVYLSYCLEPSVLSSVGDRKLARCTASFASQGTRMIKILWGSGAGVVDGEEG